MKYYIEKGLVCKIYKVKKATDNDKSFYTLIGTDIEFLKAPSYCHLSEDRKGWSVNSLGKGIFCYEIGFNDFEYFEFETDEEALLYEELLDE